MLMLVAPSADTACKRSSMISPLFQNADVRLIDRYSRLMLRHDLWFHSCWRGGNQIPAAALMLSGLGCPQPGEKQSTSKSASAQWATRAATLAPTLSLGC